jgi:hypothetical protein
VLHYLLSVGIFLGAVTSDCMNPQEGRQITMDALTRALDISPIRVTNIEAAFHHTFRAIGQIADMVKKAAAHDKKIDRKEFLLYYTRAMVGLNSMCRRYGVSLIDLADSNIKKIEKRHPEGRFTTEYHNKHQAVDIRDKLYVDSPMNTESAWLLCSLWPSGFINPDKEPVASADSKRRKTEGEHGGTETIECLVFKNIHRDYLSLAFKAVEEGGRNAAI